MTTLLSPDASSDTTPAGALAVDPDPVAIDPTAAAAETLFGDEAKAKQDADAAAAEAARKAADTSLAETPEQKAAREAKERESETPEQKAEREAKEKEDKAKGAPEAYEDFMVPEGVTLDAEALGEFKDVAKELNLDQDGAQKLVDQAVKLSTKWSEKAAAQLDTIKAGWIEATKTDKEFGGDKLNASLAVAQAALKQFGTPELNELVVGASLGDHPEFVRFVYRVGKAVSEAPIVNGGQPAAKDAASTLYPNLK